MNPDYQAEKLKIRGNKYFREQNYKQAIMCYTLATEHQPNNYVLYSNRALCRLHTNDYTQAIEDLQIAIKINPKIPKSYFLLGKALLHQNDFEAAEKTFNKALELCKEKNLTDFSDIVYKSLYDTRKKKWEQTQNQKRKMRNELKQYISKLMDMSQNMLQGESLQEHNLKRYQIESFFDELEQQEKEKTQVPESLCCKITFELMKDPVITKSGITYEKSALLSHFKINGYTDPVTREPCTEADLIPNLAVKAYTEEFLRENPWAFES